MSPSVLAGVCALAIAALAPSAVFAQTAPGTPQPPTADSTYDAAESWLCRPGCDDLCSRDQAVTILEANGTRSKTLRKPAADAPVDCFYVYPTISTDTNPNSNLKAGPGEMRATAQPSAPMYRQVALPGLRSRMKGQRPPMHSCPSRTSVLRGAIN